MVSYSGLYATWFLSFRVELLFPYVPVAGPVCGGGSHGVLAVSLRKRINLMKCMKCRCIMGASIWSFLMWFLYLLVGACCLVVLSGCVWIYACGGGVSRLIMLNSCGIRFLGVSKCSCHCMQLFTSQISSVVFHCMDIVH